MIDPTSATAAAASAAQVSASAQKSGIDQQQFLKLFIEQLKAQDPLSPMEPNELTAQLAQFSSLEQLTGINTRLDNLQQVTSNQITTSLLGLLGQDVRFEADRMQLEDGQAPPIHFSLSQKTTGVVATIRDANGSVVRTVDLGALAAGDHEFTFDGKSSSGATLGDGTYRVELSAKVEGSSDPLAVPVQMTGVVEGVDFTTDPPTVSVLGQQIGLDKIIQVRPAAQDQAA
jgi:flagellar basal-body rod modification protein FlgD